MFEDNDDNFDGPWWRNKNSLYRYFIMINICIAGTSTKICHESAGAFQEAVLQQFHISFTNFSLMYSIYSWPNTILSLFGGIIIDRVFGLKTSTLLCAVIFTAGHFIFSLGALVSSYWCALMGRFFSGIGMEFLFLCLQVYALQNFRGKEVCLVMCLIYNTTGIGVSIVYAMAEPLHVFVRQIAADQSQHVGIALFIVGCFSIVTFISCAIVSFSNLSNKGLLSSDQNKMTTKITLRGYMSFPIEFWLIVCIQIAFNVIVFAFLPYTQDFFKTVFSMSVDSANSVTSFFSIIGAVGAPFIGIILDKLGRGLMFSKIALVTAIIAYLLLGFTSWSPYIGMLLLALSFAVYNGCIGPMFAYIVPECKLGTGSGVQFATISACYSLIMYLAGLIVDVYSYRGLELLMLSLLTIGLVMSTTLWIKDGRGSGILNMTPSQRRLHLLKMKELEENYK